MTLEPGEIIAAIATPPGKGAIAVVRLSGPGADQLVLKQFRAASAAPALPGRRPVLGRLLDRAGQALDRVLVTFFPAPDSYTGEDVVEISCHGSPVVAGQILQAVLARGARLAEPGEFTMRAFLHGKMDLVQAEAVRDLIQSRTGFQAQVAAEQLEGRLSRELQPLKKELVRILCHMETALEFVEDEVVPETRQALLAALQGLDAQLAALQESFQLGRIVQEGLTVAIAGKPNTGKSSIFNSLLLEDRAIVADLPGTTRDALSETIELGGIPARLVDTAGIRPASHPVEQLGVEKSLSYLRQADAILFVMDQADVFDEQDRHIWELVRRQPCLLVLNKEDLPRRIEIPAPVEQACSAAVAVSALHHTHLEELRAALLAMVAPPGGLERQGAMLTNIRHRQCVVEARRRLRAGRKAYAAGASEEFPLYDLRKALQALGQITGETSTEDLLEQIFSTFCIGK